MFGIKLREDQSAEAFMEEVEKRVNVMVGEYTMNEYKAYKALVKHKKKINRVFSEVCGDKFFSSRGPCPKLKLPAVAVASCLAAPINAPRIRSSKRGPSPASEGTSSGVKPSRTKSLKFSKRKRKTSEQTSEAELQAASGLARMSRKKLKKAVKKVSSVGVRRVPSAFDDDAFMETDSLKGVFLWPLFNFRDNCPSGSENEFMDVDSFSDAAPEVHKEAVPAAADESTIAGDVAAPLRPPLLLKPLLLMSLNPLSLGMKPPSNLPKSLSSLYKGGRILPNTFPWSKFGRLFPTIRLPLPLWPLSTRALVRLIVANY
jgi:hypothetical protein